LAPSFNTDIQVRSIFGSDCSELLVFYYICTVFSVFSTTLKSKKLQQHSVHNISCTLFVKPFRVRQNAPFCKKKLQNFLGRGHSPLFRPHPQWGGTCSHSTWTPSSENLAPPLNVVHKRGTPRLFTTNKNKRLFRQHAACSTLHANSHSSDTRVSKYSTNHSRSQ